MPTTFVTADLHLGHNLMTQVRPWSTLEEHDWTIIHNWNERVRPNDTVYVLGDFCINRRALYMGQKLIGKKILIKGNHDVFRVQEYIDAGFSDLLGCKVLRNMILTHIPIHPNQLERFKINIHGHMHSHSVKDDDRYQCVSVEQTNYIPLSLEELNHVRR